jgi:hypothetical protein
MRNIRCPYMSWNLPHSIFDPMEPTEQGRRNYLASPGHGNWRGGVAW